MKSHYFNSIAVIYLIATLMSGIVFAVQIFKLDNFTREYTYSAIAMLFCIGAQLHLFEMNKKLKNNTISKYEYIFNFLFSTAGVAVSFVLLYLLFYK